MVDWGPVGEITYRRTYARPGEDWEKTIRRVVAGVYSVQQAHCEKYNRPWSHAKAEHSQGKMLQLMRSMKFLPPGRGLWAMGSSAMQKGGAVLNNCGFVSTANDVVGAASWLMDMLMLGVGVGFDTLGAGTRVNGPLCLNDEYFFEDEPFVIADTREGWVSSVRELLHIYLRGLSDFEFDYSQIRPAGAPIAGFGGAASGPQPLIELHNSLRKLLDARVGYELRASDVVDIMNMIGRCVVAGNVRRSAEIAFGPADEHFLNLKNPELYPDELASHRWASNNSVFAKPGDNYADVAASIARNGEPGVMWLDHARDYGRMGRRPDHRDHRVAGANPCAEQSLEHKELCCLVETFPSRCESYYEFQEVLKYAYLYAKAVTLVDVHDHKTDAVIKRNRRIGCSMSGIQDAILRHGNYEFYTKWCNSGYKYLKALDERYSEWLGVPRSIKLTSVKPSGTVSKLPGVSSGVHYHPARHYYQTIRFDSASPYLATFRNAGYRVVDLVDQPGTSVVYFACKAPSGSRCESEVSAWEQLIHAVNMQKYWADNQVSVTIKFQPHEADQIEPMLRFAELGNLKAVSFLPTTDHGFEHAPWQPITEEEYNAYVAGLSPVDLSGGTHEAEDKFCDGDTCVVPTGDNQGTK